MSCKEIHVFEYIIRIKFFVFLHFITYIDVLIMIDVVMDITCIVGPTIRLTRRSPRANRQGGGGGSFARTQGSK